VDRTSKRPTSLTVAPLVLTCIVLSQSDNPELELSLHNYDARRTDVVAHFP
jgi:hypothetical protein